MSGRAFGWALVAVAELGVAGWSTGLGAQMATGPSTGGAAALNQAERMLGRTKRVLLIAAHPDDENTELLATLVRGEGAEAAYLSLSRGEGGQNLIGPELGVELGLIRTEELLAARRLDGARQYFTRAFDFGFSKTIEEASRFWPRDSVLKDAVRIVRRFRPQILVAVFSGTPRDGHGQHQMSGWVAQEAFRAAGDSSRFPELAQEGLRPWSPLKLYRSSRFDPGGGATIIRLDGGRLDRDIGQSYRQIASQSRSRHRSQDMGVLQEPGPSEVRLAQMEDRTGGGGRGLARSGGPEELWRGIDTSAVPPGGTRIEALDQARHAAIAAANRAGLVFDATTTDGRLVPGQRVGVRLLAWNAGTEPVTVEMDLLTPSGWRVTPCTTPRTRVGPGTIATCDAEIEIPEDARYTTPYFLMGGGAGNRAGPDGMYQWGGDPADWGEPFETPPLRARFGFATEGGGAIGGGRSFTVVREVVHRYRDQAIGEIRNPIAVVPRVDVKLDPPTKVWAASARAAQPFTVTLQHGAAEPTSGTVRLELPPGWQAVAPQSFSLSREDERKTLVFPVQLPAGLTEGRYLVRALALDSTGRRYDVGRHGVDYPHIQPRGWIRPATSEIRVAAIALPRVARVGYIRGAADRVPEALAGIGIQIELLDASALERGDLQRFDAIVVGSRAYETEPALADNNGRLLEYARAGGRLVVQYQQQRYFQGRFAPAPLTLGEPHDRVTEEGAPVQVLEPEHAVLTRPNRIGPADWTGWIQERGLYFARTWDSTYRPLLVMADSGGTPLRGGLLIRPLGKGTYIYTGLAFFRQLPAGVSGAFRLFLNLLGAGR